MSPLELAGSLALFLVFLSGSVTEKPTAKPVLVGDAASLGIPFDRYKTQDAFGRTITFYLSQQPKGVSAKVPLEVFVQGSGCFSHFFKRDGKVYGGLQNLLLDVTKQRARVLVVEKPGVEFGTRPKQPGSAEESSAEFRREHVLPRWVEAIAAALRAARTLPVVDSGRTLVVGHSEGGIVAAHVAAADPLVTHVAVLAGGGPTQLFDLLELRRQPNETPAAADARIRQFYEEWSKVLADPDNADKLWLGHPYRRWTSFLKTSTLQGLLQTKARVFIAQGTTDTAVALVGFDMLRAELAAHGREVTAERLEGYDHSFRKANEPASSIDGIRGLFGRVVEWFLSDKRGA